MKKHAKLPSMQRVKHPHNTESPHTRHIFLHESPYKLKVALVRADRSDTYWPNYEGYIIKTLLDCSRWHTITSTRFFTFDLELGGHGCTKCCLVPSTLCDLCTCEV